MESKGDRDARFWVAGALCAIAAAIAASVVHVLVWLDAASILVATIQRVLLWAFVLCCVGLLAVNPQVRDAGYAKEKMARYKLPLSLLLLLWLGYSGLFVYLMASSSPSITLLRPAGTLYAKVYQLWSSSGYVLIFASAGLYWGFVAKSLEGTGSSG